jgi:hypothetical protein
METFQGFRGEKFKRKSVFVNKSKKCKECRGRRILRGFKENKAQEGVVVSCTEPCKYHIG